jgi:hypothetical protein
MNDASSQLSCCCCLLSALFSLASLVAGDDVGAKCGDDNGPLFHNRESWQQVRSKFIVF